MLLVISPAKSLELTKEISCSMSTIPQYQEEIEPIVKVLKKLSVKQIEKRFHLSKKLAELNYARYQVLGLNENIKSARQAIFTFDGEVYAGFDAYSLQKKKFEFTQSTIRILSGLYGILKPFDLIEPYRLEMGSDIASGRKKNLYQYWSEKVTNSLNEDLRSSSGVLLNLASIEYSKVINRKELKGKLVDIDFLEDEKEGGYKNISFFSKKARGLMARYIVEHSIVKLEDIKSFDAADYQFNQSMSKDFHYIFSRKSKK